VPPAAALFRRPRPAAASAHERPLRSGGGGASAPAVSGAVPGLAARLLPRPRKRHVPSSRRGTAGKRSRGV